MLHGRLTLKQLTEKAILQDEHKIQIGLKQLIDELPNNG